MKELAGVHLLFILFVALIMPIHASVTMEATIDQSIHVVLNFENVNSPIYDEIKQTFNVTTIPLIIVNNLKQQGLTQVRRDYSPEIGFDDSTNSIHVEFFLGGSDIITFTFNKTTMARLYQVRTEWRKININLAENFSINLNEYFGTPIADWDYTDSEGATAYYYEYTEDSFTSSCKFVLPKTATNIQATEDTIFFETPPLLEDVLLNSSFLILGALIMVIIVAFIYRKIRK